MPLQAPEYIQAIVPYVPGKPIEETQREFKLKRVIKLASNENPLGPSPKAAAIVRKKIGELHRYPDGAAFALKRALAKHHRRDGVEAANLLIGNGSNEIIDMLVRTFCVPGDAIVTSQAAFIAYKICAQIQGVKTLEAAMGSDLRFDLNAMLKLVRENDRARIVFLPNPNNPTGTYVSTAELRAFVTEVAKIRGGSVLVAIDDAYGEYVTAKDLKSPVGLAREFSGQIMVMRTFSKVYGLAGLRVGYGIASPELIAMVEKVRQPFNLNSLALAAAEAALGDRAFVTRARKVNNEGMKFWMAGLKKLGIPFWPSQGNFILVDVQKGMGRSGGEVYQACLRRGVIFRPVTNYGIGHALRISIGTMEENRLALKALTAEMKGGHA